MSTLRNSCIKYNACSAQSMIVRRFVPETSENTHNLNPCRQVRTKYVTASCIFNNAVEVASTRHHLLQHRSYMNAFLLCNARAETLDNSRPFRQQKITL